MLQSHEQISRRIASLETDVEQENGLETSYEEARKLPLWTGMEFKFSSSHERKERSKKRKQKREAKRERKIRPNFVLDDCSALTESVIPFDVGCWLSVWVHELDKLAAIFLGKSCPTNISVSPSLGFRSSLSRDIRPRNNARAERREKKREKEKRMIVEELKDLATNEECVNTPISY